MAATAEAVVLEFVAAINSGDADRIRSLMTEDHRFTDALGNSMSGAQTMYSGWQHFLHAYPEYRIRVTQSFAKGDEVALFGTAEGGWRVGDRVLVQRWNVRAAWLARVVDGKVREWSVFCDTGWAKPPV